MNAHRFIEPREPVAARSDIAAFAATLAPTDPLYWSALAAADGCGASLAELNAMLVEADCHPFATRSLTMKAA